MTVNIFTFGKVVKHADFYVCVFRIFMK